MSAPCQTPEPFAEGGQRDLFRSYSSINRDAVISVRRALGSLEVSTFYDRADLDPGQPWFDELEAALRQVRGVAVFIAREGLRTIQKREMQFALNCQAAEARAGLRFPVIPVLLEGVDLEAVSGFLALNTWVDLRRQLDDPTALCGFVKALRRQAPSAAPETANVCPFRGLNAFREEDAALFFGREAFAQRLLALVLKRNFVAVIGSSGSGKSSVVQAGLLPLLLRQKPPEQTWESVIFTPGNRPFHRLAAQLVPLWSPPERDQTDITTESEKLGERLSSETGWLRRLGSEKSHRDEPAADHRRSVRRVVHSDERGGAAAAFRAATAGLPTPLSCGSIPFSIIQSSRSPFQMNQISKDQEYQFASPESARDPSEAGATQVPQGFALAGDTRC